LWRGNQKVGLLSEFDKKVYSEFTTFIARHQRSYHSKENHNYRFSIFKDNFQKVATHN